MDEDTANHGTPPPPKSYISETLRQHMADKQREVEILNEHPLNQAALRRMRKEGLSPQTLNTMAPWASHLFLLARHYLFELADPPLEGDEEEAIELDGVMDLPGQQLIILENLSWIDPPEELEAMTEEEVEDTVMYHVRMRLRP